MATKYVAGHQNPQGPGDARPTALQIIKDEGLENKLPGKNILITGASAGLGVETARALFETGAARNLSKATTALGQLASSPRVHLLHLDLNSLTSVRKCASDFLASSSTLNIFIANAGVMATPEGRTEDGFETQFGTNHLAHFLLFNLLTPALLSGATPEFPSRAVLLSSVAHHMSAVNFDNLNFEGNYDPWAAYGASKTAIFGPRMRSNDVMGVGGYMHSAWWCGDRSDAASARRVEGFLEGGPASEQNIQKSRAGSGDDMGGYCEGFGGHRREIS